MAEQEVLWVAADECQRVDVRGPQARPRDLCARRRRTVLGTAGEQEGDDDARSDCGADARGDEPSGKKSLLAGR